MMKTDATFCTGENGEVSRMIGRRRRHEECKAGRGQCEVILGQTCGGPKKGRIMVLREWVYEKAEQIVGETNALATATWAAGALLLSLLLNLWLMINMKRDVLGLLVPGEGAVWPIERDLADIMIY